MEDNVLWRATLLACRVLELVFKGTVDAIGGFCYLFFGGLQYALLEVVDVAVFVHAGGLGLLVPCGEKYLAQLFVFNAPGTELLVGIDEKIYTSGVITGE